MALQIDSCIAQHIGDRREQQDRATLISHPKRPGMLLAVLADGMGGHSGGAMAAEQVLHNAERNFESYSPNQQAPREFLKAMVDESHVVIKLTRFTSEQEPHSTACVLLVQSGRADWAHCGDSRIYHFRGDRLVSRTQDHSLVAELVRQGKLDAAAAERHPQKNMLLACLGGQREPVCDFGETDRIVDGDSFLLCSDGLWAYFSDAELGGVLAAYGAREAAGELISRARARGQPHGDNVSLVIVKITDPEAQERLRQERLRRARRKHFPDLG